MNQPSAPSPAPRWAWLLATGFGSGHLPLMPGTWGSLAALGAWLFFTLTAVLPFVSKVMAQPARPRIVVGLGALQISTPFTGSTLGQGQPGFLLGYLAFETLFLVMPILLTWAAVRASELVSRERGLKDPSFIVADEWAGMWIALWPLRWVVAAELPSLLPHRPLGLLLLLAVPFLLFRLFDIWKPWPVRQAQSLPGGQGIVADDVIAGLYALLGTQLLLPGLLTLLR